MKADLRALIVDDDKNFIKAFQTKLRGSGFAIADGAIDKEEALKLALNRIYHAVFIDHLLLNHSGAELASKLRSILGRSFETVMISGLVREEDAKEDGCLFLKKPISFSALNRVISHLKRGSAANGAPDSLMAAALSPQISSEDFLRAMLDTPGGKVSSIEVLMILGAAFRLKESLRLSFFPQSAGAASRFAFQNGQLINFRLGEGILDALLKEAPLSSLDIQQIKEEASSESAALGLLIQQGALSPLQAHDFQLKQLNSFFEALTKERSWRPQFSSLGKEEDSFLFLPPAGFEAIAQPFVQKIPFSDFLSALPAHIGKAAVQLKSPRLQTGQEGKEGPAGKDHESPPPLCLKAEDLQADPDAFRQLMSECLQGEALLKAGEAKDRRLIERYTKLEKLFADHEPKKIFQLLAGGKDSSFNMARCTSAYKQFVLENHEDKLPQSASAEEKKRAAACSALLKAALDKLMHFKEEEKGSKPLKKSLELLRQRAACKKLLEKKEFEKAYQIVNKIDKQNIKKDINWMLLALWLACKAPNLKLNKSMLQECKTAVMMSKHELIRSSLFFYVLGLLTKPKNGQRAMLFFSRSKDLDSSFLPAYEDYKRTSIEEKSAKKKFDFKRLFAA